MRKNPPREVYPDENCPGADTVRRYTVKAEGKGRPLYFRSRSLVPHSRDK